MHSLVVDGPTSGGGQAGERESSWEAEGSETTRAIAAEGRRHQEQHGEGESGEASGTWENQRYQRDKLEIMGTDKHATTF